MANRFVVADASKCIGCKTCEIACAVSHNNGQLASMTAAQFTPRLKVIKSGSVTTPVMCRQCDNAPCASVCPTGAIVRANDTIQVIQERCIGCKSCAMICPFGAMFVKTEVMKTERLQATASPIKTQALKCDLCIDNPKGPACVAVCPTKAITIVYPASLDDQIKIRQQQTALGQVNAFL